jgi:hypothetical protein
MAVDSGQREAYRVALQAWKTASQAANGVRTRLHNAPTDAERLYVMTNQELQVLRKEHDLFQRLQSLAGQL